MRYFDKIVVGAGSAGCVMASRLSESAVSVLLLEAGPLFNTAGYPEELLDVDQVTTQSKFTWGYKSEPSSFAASFDAPAAKLAGGGSAINAGIIRRPGAVSFERWARFGLQGWSHSEIDAAFTRVESVMPIEQLRPATATRTLNAFVSAAVSQGFDEVADSKVQDQPGVSLEAKNVVQGKRINSAIAYLSAEVRSRPNLYLRADTQVDRVEFAGSRAIGVRLISGEVIQGDEIILCAGAFGSPVVLLRSGIGPAHDLEDQDIKVLAKLPVGRNLRDHPMLTFDYLLRPEIVDLSPARGAVLSLQSTVAKIDDSDLWVFATNILDPVTTRPTLKLSAAVMYPESIGFVATRSRDPLEPPVIHFNLLDEASDRLRMSEALDLSYRLLHSPCLAELIEPACLPEMPLGSESTVGLGKGKLTTFYHSCCTARMGLEHDPAAVVSFEGKVHGIEHLRVVDASIFPDIVSAPINFTTLMVAERIATAMRTSEGLTA